LLAVVPPSANEANEHRHRGLETVKRTQALLTIVILVTSCAPALCAAAETASHMAVKPKSANGHKAPMRHDQLTLYPHGKPARRRSPYGSAYNRFNQPSPIHNTFMGVQRW
jgi:hypothetical protein